MVVGWDGPRKLPGGEGPRQALESGQSDEKCGVGSCRYLDSIPNNTATALQGEFLGSGQRRTFWRTVSCCFLVVFLKALGSCDTG